jgi:hypothetical protein
VLRPTSGVVFDILSSGQSDLRDNTEAVQNLKLKGQAPISFQQGANLAKELKCVKYMECSSKNQKVNTSLLKPVIVYYSTLCLEN